MEVLRFALLGLGAGGVYLMAGQGLLLVYRGSGVVNFAQGAMGMVGAFAFYEMREVHGLATPLAFTVAVAGSAVLGAAVHLGVMRPLRHAPSVARLLGPLGVLTVLVSAASLRYPRDFLSLQPVLPSFTVEPFADTALGVDRLVICGFGIALTAGFALVLRYTRFGLAMAAVAENQRTAATFGVSPDRIAGANWAVAGALATAAAIFTASLSGVLSANTLVLLVLPGLAAALVGGFRSFLMTGAGALAIGVAESEMSRYVTTPGAAKSVPFLIIVVALVVRGRALPLRDELVQRAPRLGAGTLKPRVFVPVVAAASCVIWISSPSWVSAVTTTCVVCLITLSLVVVTGMAGQVSLAQYAIAGTAAWMASRSVVNYGLSFPVAAVLAVAGAVPLGVLVGVPALRTRGVNLAVATLGLALGLEQMLFGSVARTGGTLGTNVGTPSLLGIKFDNVAHPERYATLALIVAACAALVVSNLRRGRAGRRLVAVRANERAAASLGIGLFGAKLYAFGLAAAIAASGGVLMAFRNPFVRFEPFSILNSIYVTMYSVIGGIGFVGGAVIGAMFSPGTLTQRVLDEAFGDSGTTIRSLGLVGGVAGLFTLMRRPDGMAAFIQARAAARRTVPSIEVPEVDFPARRRAAVLRVEGLSVSFGGVSALTDADLVVEPGQVVGLIGPNGAGKTTWIDAVTGFVPAQGRITLDGVDISAMSAASRARDGIARSFQSLELFESLTIEENLQVASDARDPAAYITDLIRPGRRALSPVAAAAVKEFELTADLHRRPEELSFGRRRLAAIARSIATDPAILLLDEPAAGLSRTESDELGALVRRLAERWRMGVLIVEHDVGLVLDICDSVVVLAEGRVIARGTPAEVRADPSVIEAYLGDEDELPRDPRPRAVGATEVLLSAERLDCGYGALAAARDVTLQVRRGEVVALLGPNGAGKTTTLLTLAGAIPPLGGEVRLQGVPAPGSLHSRTRAGLSLLTDDRAVLRSLSASANLRLARADVGAAVSGFPELTGLLERRAGLLSGGEQQILSLARVLASDPRLLLVDEMSQGLAPMVTTRLLDAIRNAADQGIGVLLVEQHVYRALAVADRFYVMSRGRIVLEGNADEYVGREHELQDSYLASL